MTEKWIIKNGEIMDTTTNMTFDSFMEIIIILNGQARHLNKMTKENKKLKSICQDHRDHAIDFKADCVRLEKENMQYAIDNKELKCTNIKLNNEINMLKITIARNESYIKRLTHTGVWENKCR